MFTAHIGGAVIKYDTLEDAMTKSMAQLEFMRIASASSIIIDIKREGNLTLLDALLIGPFGARVKYPIHIFECEEEEQPDLRTLARIVDADVSDLEGWWC